MIAMKKWQMELNGQNMLCYAGDRRCAELSVKTDLPQSWHCQLGLRSKESVAFYPLEWEDGYLHAELTEHELPCDGWYELQILGTRGAVQKSTEPFRIYICRADDGARQAAEQARRKAKEAGKQAETAEKARRGAEQAVGHSSASATAAKHAALMAQQAQDAARSAQEQTAQHLQQVAESAARAEAYKTDALGYKKEAAHSAQMAAEKAEEILKKDCYTKSEAQNLFATVPVATETGVTTVVMSDSAEGSITVKFFGNTVQGAAPSPETPALLQSVEDNISVRLCGQNLCQMCECSGRTSVRVNVGCYLPAGIYTIAAVVTSEDTENSECAVKDATNGTVLGRLRRGDRQTLTFTLNEPCDAFLIFASINTANSTGKQVSVSGFQLERGSTASADVSYAGQDYPVALEDIDGKRYALCSVADAADSVERASNGYFVVKRCGQVRFTGLEDTWSEPHDMGNGVYRYSWNSYIGEGAPGVNSFLCSHFSAALSGNTVGRIYGSSSQARMWFLSEKDSLEKWKNWLSEQNAANTPVTVVYPLAQQTEIALAEDACHSLDSMQTQKNGTVLLCSADAPCSKIEVEYHVDMWKRIRNIENAIVTIGGIDNV